MNLLKYTNKRTLILFPLLLQYSEIELAKCNIRTMLLFNIKTGLKSPVYVTKIKEACGEQLPSDWSILEWFRRFRNEDLSIEDAGNPLDNW